MKIAERNTAINLRKEGKTFREILKELSVSKGSLSYWLRNIELTPEQQSRIRYKNDTVKKRFIQFNKLKKELALADKKIIVDNAAREIDMISERELKLMGIALYWAEGYKGRACRGVEFTNTDPSMIRLMMRWLRKICGVDEDRFRIRVQLHNEKDIEKSKKYWSEITEVPISQFTKAYVKISPTSNRKTDTLAPYGICNIRVSSINLITKIRGWIKGIMALSSSPV